MNRKTTACALPPLSLALLLVAAGCGGASTTAPAAPTRGDDAASESGSKEPVTLRYGWQPGTRLSVTEHLTYGDQTIDSTFDMAVEEAPEGLRVRLSGVHTTTGGASKDPDDAFAVALMTAARSDYVIGKGGALSAVEYDGDRVAQALLKSLPPDASEEQKALMTGMAGGLARGASEAQVKEEWADLVGIWAGLSLTPGGPPTKLARKQQLGMLGDTELEVSARLESLGPCPDGKGTCAKLVYDAAISPKAEPSPGFTVDLRRRFELVTDVATLIPYSCVLDVQGSVAMEPGTPGEPMPHTRVERTYKRL